MYTLCIFATRGTFTSRDGICEDYPDRAAALAAYRLRVHCQCTAGGYPDRAAALAAYRRHQEAARYLGYIIRQATLTAPDGTKERL